jgi:hypothetical protein
MIIRLWNLDQGRRSIRAGMVLRITGASAVLVADAIVYLRLGVFPERLFTPVVGKHTASDLPGDLFFPAPITITRAHDFVSLVKDVSLLREHLLAGRLTPEEFEARAEAALAARVGTDLARIQDDLPRLPAQAPGSPGQAARFTTGLFGHVVRRGRLRLRGWTAAVTAFAYVDFDLREAIIDRPQTRWSSSRPAATSTSTSRRA